MRTTMDLRTLPKPSSRLHAGVNPITSCLKRAFLQYSCTCKAQDLGITDKNFKRTDFHD